MIRKCHNKALKTKKVCIKEIERGEMEFKVAGVL